jgi:hypothetical protein
VVPKKCTCGELKVMGSHPPSLGRWVIGLLVCPVMPFHPCNQMHNYRWGGTPFPPPAPWLIKTSKPPPPASNLI